MPGLPLGFTSDGPRLYGPAPVCSFCRFIDISPGALVTCARCGSTVHPYCLETPVDQEAVRRGCWVCSKCACCDSCGKASSNEISGHWPAKTATDLQAKWHFDTGMSAHMAHKNLAAPSLCPLLVVFCTLIPHVFFFFYHVTLALAAPAND